MEVMPLDMTALAGTIGGILIVLVPVAGVTARFAFKPIVEAIAAMREGRDDGREVAIMEQRIDLLEQQVRGLERLVEDTDFRRQLEGPRS